MGGGWGHDRTLKSRKKAGSAVADGDRPEILRRKTDPNLENERKRILTEGKDP